MKNIHLLPTDKPTRLFKITRVFVFDVNGIKYTERYKQLHKYINQNIYITSDEEIKQRDWYIDTSVFKENIAINRGIYQMKCFKWGIEGQRDCKKIILTTDQDLIKDGVQAIDDEFLEWFVENPSCERVYVEKEKINLGYVSGTTYVDFNYKIIIPQSLVGRKIIGFKFQEKNEFHWWREEMEKYIGVVGQITGVSMDCIDVVVKFANDDTIYRYPFELINKHLVNDDKIKPKQSTKDRILSETSEETKQKARDYANSLITKLNMTSNRIKEIQVETAYPQSRSVHQALLKVWNECEQECKQKIMYSEEDMLEFSEWVSDNDWVYLPSKGCWVNEEEEESEEKFTTKELFNKFKNK